MNWQEDVKIKLHKGNRILFSKDSELLQDLNMLLRAQNHRTIVLWAFELAVESIETLAQKYPNEKRPAKALIAAKEWAAGRIKMRAAQRKILDCHAFAKELDCKADIAMCHAIGQACSVVHAAGHALGYPIYDLTAIVYREGIENCAEAVEKRSRDYPDKLLYWNAHLADWQDSWADFLLK